MKTEIELFENALDTTSVNGKKLREYINENYISNSVLDKIIAGLKAHKWNKDEGSKAIYNSAIDDAITYIEEYKASEEKE